MVSIPKHVQEFLPGKLGWVATASRDGVPKATPKGSVKLLDEHHVLFADLFSLEDKERTYWRTTRPSRHCGRRVRRARADQLKGTAVVISSGPSFDETAKQIRESAKGLPPVQQVVKITVDAVFDQSVGPDAGKQIA